MPDSTRVWSHIAATALLAQIEAGAAPTILDVRSRREFERGHVPGALHIPFWKVLSRRSGIPTSTGEPLVVYCGHGPRAVMAGALLRVSGFRQVTYLKGHMREWRRLGLRQAVGCR